MAAVVLCDPTYLYNILNQYHRISRLADTNYLCLIDTRPKEEYLENHIITARIAKLDTGGKYVIPADLDIECVQHCVVYDYNTSSLQSSGPAIQCSEILSQVSFHPIHILTGGYEVFACTYPFLRTQTFIYTIKELESLTMYPVELLPGKLYMGDYKQATDAEICKQLKLRALICVSDEISEDWVNALNTSETRSCTTLNIPVPDLVDADLYAWFERVCGFISSYVNDGSAVLIFSRCGISRCSVVTMAFLIYHLKYTLKESWEHVLKCKTNMRPNRGFVQQLSDWELHTLGQRLTDIAEPSY